MKTKNPSLDEMFKHYFHSNQNTIQLKNGKILIGTFTNSPIKESNIITGWYFKPKNEEDSIIIPHDQILMIEKNF